MGGGMSLYINANFVEIKSMNLFLSLHRDPDADIISFQVRQSHRAPPIAARRASFRIFASWESTPSDTAYVNDE